MRIILAIGAGLAWLAGGTGHAQRDVLLEICNETGFTVASAAAYRTSPSADRTLRTWFLVQPGECLDGALNGVVGEDVDLHVMSGEWHWPAGSADAQYCVSANSATSFASTAPCGAARESRSFRRLPVSDTGLRGSGGRNVGRVRWRIQCSGLDSRDAALCPGAPQDERGLAQPVRTLEVCNTLDRNLRVAILEATADGNFRLRGRHALAGNECADLYRGFPSGDELMVAEIRHVHSRQEGFFCLPVPAAARTGEQVEGCDGPDMEPVGFRMHAFGPRTARYTAYVGR